MIIKKIIDFSTDENCYILHNEKSDKCIVIDPGNSFLKLSELLKKDKLCVCAILLTHCHYDHVCAIEELKNLTNAYVIASEECKENIKNPVVNVSYMFGENFFGDFVDKTMLDLEEIMLADMKIKCIKTPGHTNCSVCYLIENNLFSGDTLFLRTTGRWDLPTGDYNELFFSLNNKIYQMNEKIKVYPGHGNSTTIDYEKKFNMSINYQN